MAGIQLDEQVVTRSAEWKLRSSPGDFLIFRLSAKMTRLEIEHDASGTLEDLVARLPSLEPRLAVLHFAYQTEEGVFTRNQSRLIYLHWIPTESNVLLRFSYCCVTEKLKRLLQGLTVRLQITESADLTKELLLERCLSVNKI